MEASDSGTERFPDSTAAKPGSFEIVATYEDVF
jgi:hypothetical protein